MNKNYEEFKKIVQLTLKGERYSNRTFDNVIYKKKWIKIFWSTEKNSKS